MVAYDSRRWPDATKRLTPETLDALVGALRSQRDAGPTPVPELTDAISTAAREARRREIPPETLLVQLKALAEDAGLPPSMGDEERNAIREWLVNACITAYYETGS